MNNYLFKKPIKLEFILLKCCKNTTLNEKKYKY